MATPQLVSRKEYRGSIKIPGITFMRSTKDGTGHIYYNQKTKRWFVFRPRGGGAWLVEEYIGGCGC